MSVVHEFFPDFSTTWLYNASKRCMFNNIYDAGTFWFLETVKSCNNRFIQKFAGCTGYKRLPNFDCIKSHIYKIYFTKGEFTFVFIQEISQINQRII